MRRNDCPRWIGICTTIRKDEKLADAVIAFDALHYGDFREYREAPNPHIVPIKTLLRYMHAVFDSRSFIRSLAVVRVDELLQRYHRLIIKDATLRGMICAKMRLLEGRELYGPDECRVFDELCALVERTED